MQVQWKRFAYTGHPSNIRLQGVEQAGEPGTELASLPKPKKERACPGRQSRQEGLEPAGAGAGVTSPGGPARPCLELRGGPELFWGLGDPLALVGGEKCLQPTRVRLCSQFPLAACKDSTKDLGVQLRLLLSAWGWTLSPEWCCWTQDLQGSYTKAAADHTVRESTLRAAPVTPEAASSLRASESRDCCQLRPVRQDCSATSPA